jgi:hypothetical protein
VKDDPSRKFREFQELQEFHKHKISHEKKRMRCRKKDGSEGENTSQPWLRRNEIDRVVDELLRRVEEERFIMAELTENVLNENEQSVEDER